MMPPDPAGTPAAALQHPDPGSESLVRRVPGPEDVTLNIKPGMITAADRPVGLRQDHAAAVLQPHQRALRQRHHHRRNHDPRQEHLRRRRLAQRVAQVGGHGLPAAQSAADLDLRERAVRRPRPHRRGHVQPQPARRDGRIGPPRRAALGRRQGPAATEGHAADARTAAETVHRPAACR